MEVVGRLLQAVVSLSRKGMARRSQPNGTNPGPSSQMGSVRSAVRTPSEHRRVPTTLVVEGGGQPPDAKRSAESRRKTLKRRKTQGSNPRWASRKVSLSRGTSASEQRLEVERSRPSEPARAVDGRDGDDEEANDRGDAARAGAEGKASKGWASEGKVEPNRKRGSKDAKER